MLVGCSFVYDLSEAEIVVRDLLAQDATYTYGQALKFGVTDGTNLGTVTTAGAGTGVLAAVSNEGGVNNAGKVLTGTVAAGTTQTLKCIVNPNAVYRIEYDTDGTLITWSAVTTTSISFVTGGAGWVDFGGGWAWSYNTGRLDWVVSSATADPTALTTVTGTDTTSTTGVLLKAQGRAIVTLNAAATKINAALLNVGTAGTNGFNAIVLGNVMLSQTYAYEKINPANVQIPQGSWDLVGQSAPTITNLMNKAVRYMASQTTDGKTMDKARAYADVWFGTGSAFSQLVITT